MTAARYTRNARIAWQIIDGEAVLVDLVRGDTLGLNETGGWIWSQLDDHSVDEITTQLSSRFGVAPAEAQRDVAEFIDALASSGLVTPKDSI